MWWVKIDSMLESDVAQLTVGKKVQNYTLYIRPILL